MDSILETASRSCRFLNSSHFQELYQTFLGAFADYVMPFDLTEVQFRNHIVLNAVELDSSVGWFESGRLVGFTLNGLGTWHGEPTVYDAGTGMLPEYRRRGISEKMFRWMLPIFAERGYRRCLLEVITNNDKAIGLYKKLGFEATRTLSLLHCPGDQSNGLELRRDIELREVERPDWGLMCSFWDGEPSWQNSPDAVERSRDKKRIVGAYTRDRLAGYIVFSENVGRVAQFAVDRELRGQGIGSKLLAAMLEQMNDNYVPQVINIDRSVTSAMDFFAHRGFVEKLSQYEMLRPI